MTQGAGLREWLAALTGTVTYAQAATALGLRPPGTITQVTALLEALMAEDAAKGQPFLAARVVGRLRQGLPAPGFFLTAAALGRYQGPAEGPEAEAFHASQLAALGNTKREG